VELARLVEHGTNRTGLLHPQPPLIVQIRASELRQLLQHRIESRPDEMQLADYDPLARKALRPTDATVL
jgi:hypothetical protein